MLRCHHCKAALPQSVLDTPDWAHCPECGTLFRMLGFPAAFRRLDTGAGAATVLAEGESSCFYHPQKKAVLHCDGCGRFLCAMCDVELSGQHLCPGCLETGRKKGKLKQLQNHRLRYDSISLALAVLPMFIFWFTVFTAPAAIFVALRYWKAPSSLLQRSKVRFVVALLIAGFQVAGWVWLAVFMTMRRVS